MKHPLLQALIRRVTPPSLSRAVLSKGIQHPDALVRYTTLCTLHKVLQTLEALIQSLQEAAHKLSVTDPITPRDSAHLLSDASPTSQAQGSDAGLHRQPPNSGPSSPSPELNLQEDRPLPSLDTIAESTFAALLKQQLLEVPYLNDTTSQPTASLLSQWTAFTVQLQQTFRARVPDPQALLAVLAALQRGGIPSADPAATNAPSEALDGSLPVQSESSPHDHPPEDDPAVIQGSEGALEGGDGITLEDDPAVVQGSEAALEGSDGMTAQQLASTVLVKVLAQYLRCLPEAMSGSHVDVVGLMPQVGLAYASHAPLRVF